MTCKHEGCSNTSEEDKDECFRHRVSGIGFSFHGGAKSGRNAWNTSKTEHMVEHLGTSDTKELGRRGIELEKHTTTPRYK